MKRYATLLLALVMILSLATTAFAADATPGSITVTGQKIAAGEETTTYEIYRIFDVTAAKDANGNYIMDGENYDSMAYTINSAWTGFFASGATGAAYIVDTNDTAANAGKGYTPIVIGGIVKYINLTDANIAAFGKAALAYSQNNSLAPVASNTTGEFTGLDLGYYMVYPKGANLNVGDYTSIVSLTTTKPNAEVVQKAEFPTLEKTDNDDSVQVGQIVTYTLTTKVPDTTGYTSFVFTIHDQLTEGLTLNENSIVVKMNNEVMESTTTSVGGYDFSLEIPDQGYSTAFKISIPVMNYQAAVGKDIVVTYMATVNENAVTKVEKNKATLEYSNDPKNASSKTTTPPDEETVFTAKIVIDKYDATNTSAKLAGAKFILRCKSVTDTGNAAKAEVGKYYKLEDGVVSWVAETGIDTKVTNSTAVAETDITENGATVVTTDANGAASFNGLENGEYELIEVAAPAGYNQIKGVAAKITVNGNKTETSSLTATATVANNSGTELPSTGGVGTTLFYIFGGLMMVGAVVLLVTKKRMAN